MQLLFVTYFIIDLIPAGNNSAQYFEEPKGTAQFWANSHELAAKQAVPKAELGYCGLSLGRRRRLDFDDDFFNDDGAPAALDDDNDPTAEATEEEVVHRDHSYGK